MSETKPAEQGVIIPQTGSITVVDENGENKELILTNKFNKFVEYYNSVNSDTFGNATRSVMKAYNLSENQYGSARRMAHENLSKLNLIARDYYDRNGLTMQNVLRAVYVKAVNPKITNAAWIDRYFKICGMMDLSPVTLNQTNVQVNINGKPEEKTDFNKEFQDFLETKKVSKVDPGEGK